MKKLKDPNVNPKKNCPRCNKRQFIGDKNKGRCGFCGYFFDKNLNPQMVTYG